MYPPRFLTVTITRTEEQHHAETSNHRQQPQMRILNQNERGIVAVNPDHVAGISIVDGECDIFMSNGTKHHVIMGDDKLTLTDAEKLDTLARQRWRPRLRQVW